MFVKVRKNSSNTAAKNDEFDQTIATKSAKFTKQSATTAKHFDDFLLKFEIEAVQKYVMNFPSLYSAFSVLV